MATASIRPLLCRTGPFAKSTFIADETNLEILAEDCNVLIIGAGGLGCELLKNAALSGIKLITLIDLDTIDVSNLNRQFLFRSGDEGKSKAQVAAARIMEVVPDCKVTWFKKKIQEFEPSWYADFDVVIAGLDNQPARSWMNKTLCDLVKFDSKGNAIPETVIPMIDGGTEGFKGQARIFFPRMSSCFECQRDSDPGGLDLHLCTVAHTPRTPEHCAMYAHHILWDKLYEFKSAVDYKMTSEGEPNNNKLDLDKDNSAHMTWLYNRALERAQQFDIKGVTYSLTQQVVKNIIPAIAATNATIAAACVNEALKYISHGAPNIDNFFFYNGSSSGMGTYCYTFRYNRNPRCEVCKAPKMLHLPTTATGLDFVEALRTDLKITSEVAMVTMDGDSVLCYSRKTKATHASWAGPLSEWFEEDEDGGYIGNSLKVVDANNVTHSIFVNLSSS